MILKLDGLIATRYAVEQLAKDNPDVTEIDCSNVKLIGVSTIHQFMLSFPDARMTGLSGWNKENYDWVIEVINSEEFKRNQGGG